MLPRSTFIAFSALRISELRLRQGLRAFVSYSRGDANEADLEAAREWFGGFNKTTIPVKIAITSFARSGGPGGQKTNK
jgi:peptidyl-tRNA hydrolase ICT1